MNKENTEPEHLTKLRKIVEKQEEFQKSGVPDQIKILSACQALQEALSVIKEENARSAREKAKKDEEE